MSKQSKRRAEMRRQAKRGKSRRTDSSSPLDMPIGLYDVLIHGPLRTAQEHERWLADLKEMA
jgi:hypothetical protein